MLEAFFFLFFSFPFLFWGGGGGGGGGRGSWRADGTNFVSPQQVI